MPVIYVDSLDDPRLDAFARLTEAQLRSKLEPERALFIAESEKVIERAFAGGMEPISLLMEEKWLEPMMPLIGEMEKRRREGTGGEGARSECEVVDFRAAAFEDPESLPVFVAPREQLEQLTGFELTRGALGAFRRPALPSVAEVLRDARLVAVLEDVTNHTNVGAIFLGSQGTQFSLTASSGSEEARIRRTRLYLKENGQAGTVQHVDFKA